MGEDKWHSQVTNAPNLNTKKTLYAANICCRPISLFWMWRVQAPGPHTRTNTHTLGQFLATASQWNVCLLHFLLYLGDCPPCKVRLCISALLGLVGNWWCNLIGAWVAYAKALTPTPQRANIPPLTFDYHPLHLSVIHDLIKKRTHYIRCVDLCSGKHIPGWCGGDVAQEVELSSGSRRVAGSIPPWACRSVPEQDT